MDTNRKEVALSAAREQLGRLVSEVRYGGARVVFTDYGEPVAVLINLADLAELEDIDAADMAVFRERAHEESVPFRANEPAPIRKKVGPEAPARFAVAKKKEPAGPGRVSRKTAAAPKNKAKR